VERVGVADSARQRAVIHVNTEQAPKKGDAGADLVPRKGRLPTATKYSSGAEIQKHRKRTSCGSCRSKGASTLSEENYATREAYGMYARDEQRTTREG
jgi:hypothetical protein